MKLYPYFIVGVKTLVLYLDDMPLITELLFIHVLSYMPLKELQINGNKSLKQVYCVLMIMFAKMIDKKLSCDEMLS